MSGARPAGGLKNKKLLMLAAIPVVVILFAVLNSGSPPATPNVTPHRPPVTTTREAYVDICASSLEPFAEYFADPSGRASRLKGAQDLLRSALEDRDHSRLTLAPVLDKIYTMFAETGPDWAQFDDRRLNVVLEAAANLRKDRIADHKIRSFADKLERWGEDQLLAFHRLEPLKRNATARELETLLDTHRELRNLPTDHVFAPLQEDLIRAVHERIGEAYLGRARSALGRGDQATARTELAKAAQFGRQKEADELLANLERSAADQDTLSRASVAFENDDLILASTLLEKLGAESHLRSEADALLVKISRRRLLLELRQHFTAGDKDTLEDVIAKHPLRDDAIVRNLVTQMRKTIAFHEAAQAAFAAEDYAAAKQALADVVNSVPAFDRDNFYKNEAIRRVAELAPDKLAQKHYQRGVERLTKVPPDYAGARDQFEIARQFDPLVAENELRELCDVADRRLQEFVRAKARGTAEDVEAAKNALSDALRWLRNSNAGSREAILYESIRSNLK